MKHKEFRDCFLDLIHEGSAELTVSDTKKKNSAFKDFVKRVFALRVFQG